MTTTVSATLSTTTDLVLAGQVDAGDPALVPMIGADPLLVLLGRWPHAARRSGSEDAESRW